MEGGGLDEVAVFHRGGGGRERGATQYPKIFNIFFSG